MSTHVETGTETSPTTGAWATPGAVQVLPYNAPREVWLAERAKGIGGSDAAAVMGFNTWTSPREVYLDKVGLLPPKAETEAMYWGKLLEDAIAKGFEHRTGIKTRRCGLLRSKAHPYLQVSVDRLTSDGGGLEIKNMGYFRADEWGDDTNPTIPDAAEIQAMHCMMVTGKDHWWVAGLINGNKLMIRRVERSQPTIDDIIAIERNFWVNHVQANVPPPVDGSAACTELLKAVYDAPDPNRTAVIDREILLPLVLDLQARKAEFKAAELRKDLAANRLRDMAGNAIALTFPGNDGKLPPPVVTYKANGQFASARFTSAEPELTAAFTESVTQTRLNVDRLKAEKPDVHAKYRARQLRITADGERAVEIEIARQAAADAANTTPTTERTVA